MLFRTQVNFAVVSIGYIFIGDHRLHFRIAEVGSLLSLNRAWRAQVTFGTVEVGLLYYLSFYGRLYFSR